MWLFSHNIMFSRFIHVVACVSTSFLFKDEQYILCIYNILFIHLSVDGYLGFFHFLAIVNNGALNMDVQISLQVPAFQSSGYIYRSGMVEHMVILDVFFEESPQCFPQ